MLVPVGALGFDDDVVAVGGNFKRGEADGVEEFVEGELGLALGGAAFVARTASRQFTSMEEKAVLWIRIGFPVGRRVIQRGIRWKQVCESKRSGVTVSGSFRGSRAVRRKRTESWR